jgi:signal transduction histidine kinase
MASLLPRYAAVCTVAIGICALSGWALGNPTLKSLFPQEAPVEANAAVALLLAGAALFRSSREPGSSDAYARYMAAAVLVIGLATLAQHVFDVDLQIDEILFRDTNVVPGSAPGRMSPYTAVAFVGIGLALATFNAPTLRPLVWTGAALTAFVGAVPIAGFLTQAAIVTESRWLSPLATTVAFVLLGVGTIVASTRAGDGAGARAPRSSVERKVIAAFAGALVLLFVGAGFTYRASTQFTGSIEGVARSEQLRESLANLHMALAGAESAQIAYLLTDRQHQRDEYERLVASARAHQQAIATHVANDPEQAADFGELDAHVNRRLDLLAEVTSLYDEAGLSSAKESVASDEGARLMRALQAVTARMDERGEALLLERESTLSRSRELTLGSLLLTLAIAAGIFLTLFRGISREMGARAESEQALRELNRKMLALNETLAQRAAEVEAANAELEAFSYSVSHDLRAPLRHIDGYVEMLKDENARELTADAQRKLDVIADSTRRMSTLIDDLLAFSRMARLELHVEPVDMDALTRLVVADLEMATRGRRIEWHIAPLPPVLADAAMLKQALANLLGNAVKYTAPRELARVDIGTAGEEGGKRVYYVRDNGVGFDMKHADRLFGIFQRLHRADQFDGTGIGLANVQRIVARHGGRVWAEAEPERGATFYFTLRPHEAPS